MSVRTITKEIQQGQFQSVYALYGTENFMIEEFIQFVKQKVLDESSMDFNYSVYDMNETPVQQAVMDAETLPFMGERRIVIIKNAFFLTGAKASSGVEHDLDSLQAYLDKPLETTIVLLIAFVDKLDERKKMVKHLKTQNAMVPFLPLKEKELWSWIIRRAGKQQVKMDDEAAKLLERLIGSDLRRLKQEIEKMAAYVGQDGTITEEVVYQLASRTLEQDIFGLIEKAANLQMDQAMRIFYDLIKNKEEPFTILHLLARQFRMILQVKVLVQKGYSHQQIASQLGVHPYPVKLAAEKSHRFSERALRAILAYLSEEDYRIKSGMIDKVLSMELFFLKIRDLIQSER